MKQPDNIEKGSRIDLIRHRFSVAKEDLDTARLLLNASQYRGANNRAYYSIYHTIDAVLSIEGKHSNGIRTHWHILTGIMLLRKSFRVRWEDVLSKQKKYVIPVIMIHFILLLEKLRRSRSKRQKYC